MNTNKIFALCAALGMSLTACDKQAATPSNAPVSNAPVVTAPAAPALTAPAGAPIVGSGVASTQAVALTQAVRSVVAGVSATFIYDPSVGDKIIVTADNNLQEQVKVSVVQGVLSVEPIVNTITQKTPIQITWGGAAPEQLEIKGSSKIILRQFKANQLNAVISGSGEINADGQTQQLNIDISGSGGFVGTQLIAQKASIKVSGSGNIVTQVKEEVTGSLTGSGSVVISGNPKTRSLTSAGSAQVVYQ